MGSPTPAEFFTQVIKAWEGLFQNQAADTGNWVTFPDGHRVLIGTMRGITPGALAAHRGIKPWEVTVDMIKAVTAELSAEIAMKGYFNGPKFNLLSWGPATAALVDWGYMSGPRQASLSLQRMVGVPDDGAVGPQTAGAYNEWVKTKGWRYATDTVRHVREAFFRSLNRPEYEQGWLNRAAWASPTNPQFWSQWSDTAPSKGILSTFGL